MENYEVKEIAFDNDELLGVRDSVKQIWLGVRQTCLNMGLTLGQTQRQITNIQNDLVLSKGVANLQHLTQVMVGSLIHQMS